MNVHYIAYNIAAGADDLMHPLYSIGNKE